MQAYIEAMSGWKSDVGRHLDALIEQAVPDVVKAVKWNQPMYDIEDQGFFVSFRCFTKYIKLTFFAGAGLEPVPPVDFKDPNEKAFHIHEDQELDEEQLTSWFEQGRCDPRLDAVAVDTGDALSPSGYERSLSLNPPNRAAESGSGSNGNAS